ncbi:TauD/TfdA family dioxygenase [Meridianimarinicoccus aquatilis]|uniref:TauD/TfdA-like domain-containing protein n=1 Tax=Meridianimarinicoccus aquatilis TaxID=2552766 RepID=A0A4R6AUA3_9RHOB|nr:TauD/TfdA family dioxygenase [Fluviibacterium aquatile]TDL86308.1 hypothetical protein E2L05_13605 [Fluviibacterium aquatile]
MHADTLEQDFSSAPIDTGIGAIIEARGRALNDITPEHVSALLQHYGVLLFRGFTHDTDGFVAFSDQLTDDFSNYRGGGLRFAMLDREKVGGHNTVLTTTGHKANFGIPLHGEMYYMKEPPQLLWFYADVPPLEGGQTTLCDGAALYQALKPETQAWFRDHQIKYVRNLVEGDWQATFMTDNLDEARAFCASNDLTMTYDPETGTVSAEFTCSALRTYEQETLFINNALFIYMGEMAFRSGWAAKNLPGLRSAECPIVVRAGDGSELPKSVIEDVQQTSAKLTRKIYWQQGDIVLINNHRVLHGRAETDSGERSILVRLGGPAFALPRAA